MIFNLTSNPSPGSILKVDFVSIYDVVSIPEPDEENNIDLDSITLVAGASWHVLEALPRTGSMVIESQETEQGTFESPNVKLKYNDASMAALNKFALLLGGKYILKPTDGSGKQYLCGTLEQYLKIKYALDTTQSRADTQVIDVEFYF